MSDSTQPFSKTLWERIWRIIRERRTVGLLIEFKLGEIEEVKTITRVPHK